MFRISSTYDDFRLNFWGVENKKKTKVFRVKCWLQQKLSILWGHSSQMKHSSVTALTCLKTRFCNTERILVFAVVRTLLNRKFIVFWRDQGKPGVTFMQGERIFSLKLPLFALDTDVNDGNVSSCAPNFFPYRYKLLYWNKIKMENAKQNAIENLQD